MSRYQAVCDESFRYAMKLYEENADTLPSSDDAYRAARPTQWARIKRELDGKDVVEAWLWLFSDENDWLTEDVDRYQFALIIHASLNECGYEQTPDMETPGRNPTQDMRHEVFRRDDGRCRECGGTERLQYDHILPWSKGGATSVQNLQLLCWPCNRRKSDKH